MGVDLGGPALEVAIGLAFVFFLMSLIVSGITEAISWARNLRGKNLIEGIHGMIGDSGIATKLLDHPLVKNDLSSAKPRKSPSYISARNFALAFADVVSGLDRDTTMREIERGIERIGPQSPLGLQLKALLVGVEDDVESFLASTEKWFDDSMDRVSGWYKRNSQKITIGAAVVVTLVLNASAIRIAERLNDDPAVRAAVVAQAEAAVAEGEGEEDGAEKKAADTEEPAGAEEEPARAEEEPVGDEEPAGEEEEASAEKAGKQVETAFDELNSLQLPILWSDANSPFSAWTAFALALAGWIITAIAISLGAPFWFDALSKLAHLRTTGKKPGSEEPS
jgi:hypothetical protein